MDKFCIPVLAGELSDPARVRSRSRAKPLCDKCAEADYRPGDIEILKHHKKLLAAAGALLDRKVAGTYEIIPTLVFAAFSDKDDVYAGIGEWIAATEASPDDEDWAYLFREFSLRFGSIRPKDSIGNVPVVWRPPLGVGLVQGNDDKPFEAVKIEVHEPVESRLVGAYYSEILELYGLSNERGRGDIRWASFGGSLHMVVRPEEDTILHPILKFTISDRRAQGAPFPHRADVAAEYEARRGQGYPKGRGGGESAKHYNAIPAVVAWYLSDRVLLEAGKEKRNINRLVKACLRGPRRGRIPELEKRWQPWRSLERILPRIKQTEFDLGLDTDLNNPYGWVHQTF